jgi:hypothetical protein
MKAKKRRKKKSAAKTEGEGECFAAGPLRASGRKSSIQPWFDELVPAGLKFFPDAGVA